MIKSYDEFLNEGLSMPGGVEVLTVAYTGTYDIDFTFEVTCKNAETESLYHAILAGAKQSRVIANDFINLIKSNTDIKVTLIDNTDDLINPIATVKVGTDIENSLMFFTKTKAFEPIFNKFIKKHKIKIKNKY